MPSEIINHPSTGTVEIVFESQRELESFKRGLFLLDVEEILDTRHYKRGEKGKYKLELSGEVYLGLLSKALLALKEVKEEGTTTIDGIDAEEYLFSHVPPKKGPKRKA